MNSFVDLILHAGIIGKIIVAFLAFVSMFSWSIIFSKWVAIRRAKEKDAKFIDAFWHSKSIEDIFADMDRFEGSPIAGVFRAGVKELRKNTQASVPISETISNIQRTLFRASTAEIALLETNVSWLATTASASPFIGLFGTVWGIMHSFQSIGLTGSANLAVVAPGIGEALITTAIGIGTAIPAVIAYNHFAGRIKSEATEMDCFTQDFLNIISRNASASRPNHDHAHAGAT